jgi:hypothetical protein
VEVDALVEDNVSARPADEGWETGDVDSVVTVPALDEDEVLVGVVDVNGFVDDDDDISAGPADEGWETGDMDSAVAAAEDKVSEYVADVDSAVAVGELVEDSAESVGAADEVSAVGEVSEADDGSSVVSVSGLVEDDEPACAVSE